MRAEADSESGGKPWQTWILERLPVDLETLRHFTNEPVPNHMKSWWWCLGGTPAILFGVQIFTGILLTFNYVPDPAEAYDSVARITQTVPYGWYIRGIHRWSSHLMIVAVILHMMRVFFTGAYRKPREINWIIGLALLAVTLFLGFTGYSLLYEQLSYWGMTVAGNLTEAVPLIGEQMARMLRGGEEIGEQTLTRFFILHIGILPTALIALLALHIALIRLHGVTEFRFEKETVPKAKKSFPFFPDHLLTEGILAVGLTLVLTCLAVIFPATVGERADPLVTPAHIKPEWYFFWTFRWLKLIGLEAAVLTIGLMGVAAALWPFVDARIRRARPNSEISVWIGVAAVLFLLAFTLWEAVATH